MNALRLNWPAWVAYGQMIARRIYIYRFNYTISIFLTGFTIYLLTVVWRAAYGDRTEVDGVAIDQLMVYLTLASLHARFFYSEVHGDIQERIREGQIGFDINRPTSYVSQLLAGATGEFVGTLPLLIVGFPVALLAGDLTPPDEISSILAYILSLALAWVVNVQLSMVIGLIAFWTLETTGFQMMYRLIASFATGALVPLWFMPDAVRFIVQLLPFQSIAFIPVSIYVGEPATGHILTAIGIQFFWIVLLIGLIRFIWSRAFLHTVIQGG